MFWTDFLLKVKNTEQKNVEEFKIIKSQCTTIFFYKKLLKSMKLFHLPLHTCPSGQLSCVNPSPMAQDV